MMTFSEDDLLPYNEVNLKPTPECIKTCLMQWIMLDDYFQETGGFVTDIHPHSLVSLCSLIMEAIVGASDFLCLPQDFEAGFEQFVNVPPSEAAVKQKAELSNIVTQLFHPSKAAMKVAVEKLIDEELKDTDIPESKWTNATLRSKVSKNLRFPVLAAELTSGYDPHQRQTQAESQWPHETCR
jgi:hypothetical protein